MSLQLYDSRWTVSYQAHSTFQSSMFEKPLDNCSWAPVRRIFIWRERKTWLLFPETFSSASWPFLDFTHIWSNVGKKISCNLLNSHLTGLSSRANTISAVHSTCPETFMISFLSSPDEPFMTRWVARLLPRHCLSIWPQSLNLPFGLSHIVRSSSCHCVLTET